MSNPWLKHVKEYRAKNPTIPYKEVLVSAKATYKPLQKKKTDVKIVEKKPKKKSGSKTVTKKTAAKTNVGAMKKLKKGGNKELDTLYQEAKDKYIELNGEAKFKQEVNSLPKFVYPKTETQYAMDLAKTMRTSPVVRKERIRLDMPEWLAAQRKDPKYLVQLKKDREDEIKRQKAIKDQEEYEKLTPAQRKKRQDAVAKAWKEGLTNEAVNKVAKTAKGYIDNVAPIAGEVVKSVNPVAGKAFNIAKKGLDMFYDKLEIPDDVSNEAGAERVANKISAAAKAATTGSGRKPRAKKSIK